jgi:hypothetical protein
VRKDFKPAEPKIKSAFVAVKRSGLEIVRTKKRHGKIANEEQYAKGSAKIRRWKRQPEMMNSLTDG